ncbi:MAG: hypothetical protein GKS05_10140 [Nitrospirales bacterium]|nr:hypothetical protein [Nitrospirales bacterium]
MFDFIRKSQLWEGIDSDWYKELKGGTPFHLKTIQDVAMYQIIKDIKFSKIAEIGGGNSRILPLISAKNECCNVDKFEGMDGGPKYEITIPKVQNLKTFLGEYSDLLKENSFDLLFSVSVVEHVPVNKLDDFFMMAYGSSSQEVLWFMRLICILVMHHRLSGLIVLTFTKKH